MYMYICWCVCERKCVYRWGKGRNNKLKNDEQDWQLDLGSFTRCEQSTWVSVTSNYTTVWLYCYTNKQLLTVLFVMIFFTIAWTSSGAYNWRWQGTPPFSLYPPSRESWPWSGGEERVGGVREEKGAGSHILHIPSLLSRPSGSCLPPVLSFTFPLL